MTIDKNKTSSIYDYISEKDLNDEVYKVVSKLREIKNNFNKKKDKELWKNNLDVFSAIFLLKDKDIKFKDWISSEEIRQIEKSFQNYIGLFHQGIAGKIKGCKRLVKPLDFKCDGKKIVAEIKNKENTVNKNSAKGAYDDLRNFIKKKKNKDYTAYIVMIIPTTPGNSFDREFKPKGKPLNKKIRKITGNKFYELLTGEKNFLRMLYNEVALLLHNKIENDDYLSFTKQKEFDSFFKKSFIGNK